MRSFRTGKQAIQLFCSAASFSLRGGRVPSKVLFTAKHLTVFGLFRIALSKRRGEKREKNIFRKFGKIDAIITIFSGTPKDLLKFRRTAPVTVGKSAAL